MAHVTIPDTSPRVQYTVGTTSTTNFSIPYAYFEDADIVVYVGSTLQSITTDYTIAGVAVDQGYSGGTVTLNTGVTNTTVTIIRDVPVERITDFPTNGPFNITQLNSELDKMTAQLQQEESGHDLFLRIADYDSYNDLTLPDLATRSGKVLSFDSATGDPIAVQELGEYKGLDTTTTTANYAVRDIVKESTYGSVYICIQASTTGTLLTNTSYWALLFDATPNNWYLGPNATAPTVDNFGSAVVAGHWHFNTTSNAVEIYDGTSWSGTGVTAAQLAATQSAALAFSVAI